MRRGGDVALHVPRYIRKFIDWTSMHFGINTNIIYML